MHLDLILAAIAAVAIATFGVPTWLTHNLIGHPLSEIAYWLAGTGRRGRRVASVIHDATMPADTRARRG